MSEQVQRGLDWGVSAVVALLIVLVAVCVGSFLLGVGQALAKVYADRRDQRARAAATVDYLKRDEGRS